MILLAADGLENKENCAPVEQDPGKVGRWRQRYVQMGLAGILKDRDSAGSDCFDCRFDALADCQTHAHRPSRQERRTGAANRWPKRSE